MEIVEGVHRVDGASDNPAHANVYLHIRGDAITVIDTGTPGNARKILDHVERLGRRPGDIKNIVITHYHSDHTGSAKELQELTGAKVAASEEEAGYVSGKKPLPKPKHEQFRTDAHFEPVVVDTLLRDGDTIAGLKVFHMPGHTPGSIMLLDEDKKVLFAGDTLRNQGNNLTGAHEEYSQDVDRMNESILRVCELDFEVMLPGHGEPIKSGACEAARKVFAKR